MSIVEANSIYESLKLHSQVPENTPEAIQESLKCKKIQEWHVYSQLPQNGP